MACTSTSESASSMSASSSTPVASTNTSSSTNEDAGSIRTNGGEVIALNNLTHWTADTSSPDVFFLSEISSDAFIKVYNALSWTPTGKVAVKISTGEPPASYYLHPELIKDLVQKVDGTIVETNTAY